MVSQNLLNLVDSFMVGRLGKVALAAIAAGGAVTWVANSIVISLSTGVQQLVSRRFGENKLTETALPLNAGLVIALLIGIPLSLLLSLNSHKVISLLTSDPEVIALGGDYLFYLFLGIPFTGMDFSFRGFWNGINRQKVYMFVLLVVHSTNILLNYFLIFGNFGFPKLGVSGAGIATLTSQILGNVIYFSIAYRQNKEMGFLKSIPKEVGVILVKLSLANGTQSFFYALSYNVVYKIIGQIGTDELAAAGVIINLALVCYLPAIAFGLVLTSMVGQAIGKNNIAEAKSWAKDISRLATMILGFASLPIIIFPEKFLAIFILETETVKIAANATRLMGVSIFIEAYALTMMHALLGAGDSKRVMLASFIMQWGIYIPLGWFLGIYLNYGLSGVWLANLLNQFILAATFLTLWQKGKWQKINI